MKKNQTFACMLAALMLTPSIAACGKSEETDEVYVPQEEEEILPQIEEIPEENEVPTVETPVAPPVREPSGAQYVCCQADELNVRSGAGTQYPSLGKAERNVLVKYAGKSGDWYETRYRGKTAYVFASYTKLVTLDKGSDETEAVVEEGLKVLGTPYVYGATRLHDGKGHSLAGFTTSKFDCSSLMQYMFYKGAGVLLDVTTRTQVLQGKPVDTLKRGDLMFFTNSSRKDKTGIERVGHVALYLGNNYILHTASDYAKIEQISATRWNYFICARRIF